MINLLNEIHHVSLHDGYIEPYGFESLPDEMFKHLFSLFAQSTNADGAELSFSDKAYEIKTESYKSEGGITTISLKMRYPSWAKAPLLTLGYGRRNLNIFRTIRDGKLGEKCAIEQVPIPYLVTRVEPGIIMDKQSLAWLTPCARCLAWMGLDVKNYLAFMHKKPQELE